MSSAPSSQSSQSSSDAPSSTSSGTPLTTSSPTSDIASTTSATSDITPTSSSSEMSQTTTTSSPISSPTSLQPETTTTTTTTPPTTTSTTTSDPPPTTSSTTTSTTTTPTSSDTTTTTSTSTSDPPTTSSDPPTTSSDPPTTSSDPPSTTSTDTVTSSSSPPPLVTTTQFLPTTTFKSTVFISTTNDRGSPISTAPPNITSTFTSVGADGGFTTVTQVIANPNPSLLSDSHDKDTGFFGNTGAVAAVFVLVGLATTSLAIWTIFAIYRRRRQSRIIQHQTADAAPTRPPLEDDDDPQQHHFSPLALQLSRTRSSPGLTSTSLGPRRSYHDDPDPPDPYNPYAEFGHIPLGPIPTNASNGYSITRTSSPPSALINNDRGQRASAAVSLSSANGLDGYHGGTHSTTPSGASMEPLLASYNRQSSGSGPRPDSPVRVTVPATAMLPEIPPVGSSQLLVDVLEPLEVRSAFTADDRLDPGLRQRQREAESASMRDLRDDEDYSRPVLGVRNLP